MLAWQFLLEGEVQPQPSGSSPGGARGARPLGGVAKSRGLPKSHSDVVP
jgi:hypothetical protein